MPHRLSLTIGALALLAAPALRAAGPPAADGCGPSVDGNTLVGWQVGDTDIQVARTVTLRSVLP
jgi:hypothetical protein